MLYTVESKDGWLIGYFDHKLIQEEFGVNPQPTDDRVIIRKATRNIRRRQYLRKSLLNPLVTLTMRSNLLTAMRKIDSVVTVVLDDFSLLGFYYESEVWYRWDVVAVTKRGKLKLRDKMSRTTQVMLLQENNEARYLNDAQRNKIQNEIERQNEYITAGVSTRFLEGDGVYREYRRIASCAFDHLTTTGKDARLADEVGSVLRRRLMSNQRNVIIRRVERGIEAQNESAEGIAGDVPDAIELVNRLWEGDVEAVDLVADYMAIDIEVAKGNRRIPKQAPELKPALPKRAKSECAYVLRWADKTLDAWDSLHEQPIALCVARAVKEGRADVLVFDDALYDEVKNTDEVGITEFDEESFPYPVSIVRLQGIDGIYGVAVCCMLEARRFATQNGMKGVEGSGLITYFIGDEAGEKAADETTKSVANKLVAYLDCDNANVETLYVNGGLSAKGGRIQSRVFQTTQEYRVGSKYVTGTRVVVTRKRKKGIENPGVARRAHFRRGHYARYRIGPRDDWHYERRWVKPTFVHGCNQVVTQHKVTRIVL